MMRAGESERARRLQRLPPPFSAVMKARIACGRARYGSLESSWRTKSNRGYKQSWALEPEFKGKPVTSFVIRVLNLAFNWFASHAMQCLTAVQGPTRSPLRIKMRSTLFFWRARPASFLVCAWRPEERISKRERPYRVQFASPRAHPQGALRTISERASKQASMACNNSSLLSQRSRSRRID